MSVDNGGVVPPCLSVVKQRGILLLVFSSKSCLSLLHEGVFCFRIVLFSLGISRISVELVGFF